MRKAPCWTVAKEKCSPISNDSEEGREKMKRRDKLLKAAKLTESWSLARECKKFLEEITEGWMKRTREETARVREEEKLERLEMVRIKKQKYQKPRKRAVNRKREQTSSWSFLKRSRICGDATWTRVSQ